MNKPKESTTRPKKTRSRNFSAKITESDVFTRMCATQFGVECIREYRFYKPRKWRFDYAMPLYKIAVEVEGGVWTAGRHIRPRGFLNDMTKYNTAALLGWRVFRTTPDKLLSNSTILLLKNAISGSFCPQNDDFLPEK